MSWSVVVREGNGRKHESAWQAAMGNSQQEGLGRGYADNKVTRRLSCDLNQNQAEIIAKFLNDGFLRIDYAAAERDN